MSTQIPRDIENIIINYLRSDELLTYVSSHLLTPPHTTKLTLSPTHYHKTNSTILNLLLKSNITLRKIHIINYKIESSIHLLIINSLKITTTHIPYLPLTIQHLHLFKCLFETFILPPNLQTLTISHCTIPHAIFHNNTTPNLNSPHILHTLHTIKISFTPITNINFVKSIPNLKKLTLKNCGIITSISSLKFCPHLRTFTYLNSSYSYPCPNLFGLKSCSHLQKLIVNQLTQNNTQALKFFAKLRTLSITSSPITNLNILSSYNHLKNLTISYTQIESINFFSPNLYPCLRTLDISHNFIEDFSRLASCSNLTSLNTSYNLNIHSFSNLSNLPNLRKLNTDNISNTQLSPTTNLTTITINKGTQQDLDTIPPNCKHLSFKSSIPLNSSHINFPFIQTIITQGDFIPQNMLNLREIEIHSSNPNHPIDLTALQTCQKLYKLTLLSCHNLTHIPPITSLTELEVSTTYIDAHKHNLSVHMPLGLNTCINLEKIIMRHGSIVTLECLTGLTNLRNIEFSSCYNLTDISHLPTAKIEYINLKSCKNLKTINLKILTHCENLRCIAITAILSSDYDIIRAKPKFEMFIWDEPIIFP